MSRPAKAIAAPDGLAAQTRVPSRRDIPASDIPFRSVAALIEQHRRRTPAKPAIMEVHTGASISFEQLALAVDAIARQLMSHGVAKGSRVVLTGSQCLDKLLLWLAIWRIGAIACPLDVAFIGKENARRLIEIMQPALVLYPAPGPAADGNSGAKRNQSRDESASQGAERLSDSAPHHAFSADIPDDCPWTASGVASLAFVGWVERPPNRDTRSRCNDALGDVLWLNAQQMEAAGIDPAAAAWPALPDCETATAPSDIASLCCTSGTTGLPKIVVYDHACYWLNGLDSIELLSFRNHDRMLEYRTFDWYSAQILSLMPFLLLGSTLCVAPRFSRSGFAGWIREHRVTVCAGVPTVLNMLLEAPIDVSDGSLASLRAMTCSTAPLSAVQWARFEARYGIRILNLYGSSEAGWMCGNRLQRRKLGTVGYPAARVAFDIVDGAGRSCGDGIEGQVVIDGEKLALGLLREDGAIEPIRGAPFFTRDVAVRDAEGFIRVAGRMDDLIIRGGVKIVPQEIEDVMRAHPEVGDVAALGVPDPMYGQETVCFVVPSPGASPLVDALSAHCRARLAREKWPKRVYLIDKLPTNARGKVKRDALRALWWRMVAPQESLNEQGELGELGEDGQPSAE
jgi:acyl-coenzyme A synthetase/AMP-(fatty) acid ligase